MPAWPGTALLPVFQNRLRGGSWMTTFSATARTLAAGVLIAIAGAAVAQQAYPGKPIRMITPYAPGGATTALARIVGQKLTESWGQQVLVENRPGGNTIIGTEALAKAAPDGYTIALMTSTHIVVSLLFPTPYDAIKDFAPVATVASAELLLVMHPSVPANSLRELIALAKSRPGQLNHGSTGSGSSSRLALELINITAGVQIQDVPYKGGGPAVADLIGGQVQLGVHNPINVVPHVKSGRLRAIAISGEHRLSALPQVPTFAEAGLPGIDVKLWLGILAPAGIAKEILGKLSVEIARILGMPEVKEKIANLGVDPFISTPEQFGAIMKSELARWSKVIKAANIRIEN